MPFLCLRFIGAIPVTIITDEEHVTEVGITSLPVEFGADITDHAYIRPKTVTLKGMVGTGTPGIVGSFISAASYQSILTYQKSRVPFTLVTGLSVDRDMLIQSVSVPRNTENAGVLEFTMKLKQVLIVSSGFNASTIGAIAGGQAAVLTATTLASGVTARRASPTVKRGDNVVKDASTDQTTPEGRRNQKAVEKVRV